MEYTGRVTSGVGDRYRIDPVGRREAEDGAVEGQLRLGGPDDCGGVAEPVPLALERQVRHRKPARAHRLVHRLRLVGWYHPVLQALEEDERTVEPVGVVHRGALLVERGGL